MDTPAGVASSRLGSAFLRAAAIAALGATLGLLVNTRHPMRLPLRLREVGGPGIPRWVWERVPNVGVTEAHRLWQRGSATVVDARSSSDYAQGHLAGSLNLPYWEFPTAYPHVAAQLPKGSPILIYCYGSHCGLSMRLAKRLLSEGYPRLIVMRGGIAAWEAAGLPIARPTGRGAAHAKGRGR